MKSDFRIAFTLFMACAAPVLAAQPAFAASNQISGQTAGKPWSLSGNAGSMRFEVRPFENARSIGDGGKEVERSEVVLGNAVFDQPVSASWNFTWDSTRGPAAPDRPHPFLIAGQWHATEDPQDVPASPPVAFDMNNGTLQVCIRFSTDAVLRKNPSPKCLTRTKIEAGRSYSLRQSVTFARNVRDSRLQVWLDGNRIVNYQGPLGYKDDRPPYLKIGIYRSHTNDIDVFTYDKIRFGAKAL